MEKRAFFRTSTTITLSLFPPFHIRPRVLLFLLQIFVLSCNLPELKLFELRWVSAMEAWDFGELDPCHGPSFQPASNGKISQGLFCFSSSISLACRRSLEDLARAIKTTEGSWVKLLSLLNVIIVSMSNQPKGKVGIISSRVIDDARRCRWEKFSCLPYLHHIPPAFPTSICPWVGCSHQSSIQPKKMRRECQDMKNLKCMPSENLTDNLLFQISGFAKSLHVALALIASALVVPETLRYVKPIGHDAHKHRLKRFLRFFLICRQGIRPMAAFSWIAHECVVDESRDFGRT